MHIKVMYLNSKFINFLFQLLTDELVDVFIVDAHSAAEVEQQLISFREELRNVSVANGQTNLSVVTFRLVLPLN